MYFPDRPNPSDHEYGSVDEQIPHRVCDVIRVRKTWSDIVESECIGKKACRQHELLSQAERVGDSESSESDVGLIFKLNEHIDLVADHPIGIARGLDFDAYELSALRKIQERLDRSIPNQESFAIILLFSPFRIRRFDEFEANSSGEFLSLLFQHLFVQVPIPNFNLKSIASIRWGYKWKSTETKYLPDFKHIMISILLGRGVSFGMLDKNTNVSLPRSVVEHMWSVPECLDFASGMIWARLRASGAGPEVSTLLSSSRALPRRWEAVYGELPEPFDEAASWLQEHWTKLTDEQIECALSRLFL